MIKLNSTVAAYLILTCLITMYVKKSSQKQQQQQPNKIK